MFIILQCVFGFFSSQENGFTNILIIKIYTVYPYSACRYFLHLRFFNKRIFVLNFTFFVIRIVRHNVSICPMPTITAIRTLIMLFYYQVSVTIFNSLYFFSALFALKSRLMVWLRQLTPRNDTRIIPIRIHL